MNRSFLLAGLLGLTQFSCAQQQTKNMQPTSSINRVPGTDNKNLEQATLGTGCFWCTEAIFEELEGVHSVTSGYAGGHVDDPSYEEVTSGNSGHAECVQIAYDPGIISFDQLLEVFWQVHDPTTLNRQGADVGPQYRSVIFYHNQEQKEKAEKYLQELDKSGAWDKPVVTTIEPMKKFYAAESYHQEYYANNKNRNPYCAIVIRPKLEKFRKVFKDRLKKEN